MRPAWGMVAVSMILAVTYGCQKTSSSATNRLKLAYVMAPGGPADEAAGRFAELVKEKTHGRVTVKCYHSAQLGNDQQLAEKLMLGSVDLVLGGTAPIGWYLPEYGAVEAPFVYRDYEHMDHVLDGEIGQKITKAFADQRGILILDWWHRGPRYLTTTNRKVTVPADLKGLKLRVPELPTYREAWDILGANPTPITYSEIFLALKQGTVEGQENPLEVIYTSSLYEVQKYVMNTRHLLGAYMLMANRTMFDKLPPEDQQAIRQAAEEAGLLEHRLMLKYDEQYIARLKEKGMKFVDVDQKAFRNAVVDELPKRFKDKWKPNLFQRISEVK